MKTEQELTKEFNEAMEAMKIFNKDKEDYCKKFGKDALDRVILTDPLHPCASEILDAAQKLRKAIRRNRPLEQVDEKMWAKLIF